MIAVLRFGLTITTIPEWRLGLPQPELSAK